MRLSDSAILEFRQIIWEYFATHARSMPWRERPEPYCVLVSELMLQQTQVERVIPKFLAFIERFPTVKALAEAPLSDVLILWNGLGYNRRAKFLWQAAQMVESQYEGNIPDSLEELVRLPGVGPNTAGAILAYAFEQPVVFIETNIRTVYFHHFFSDYPELVTDKQLRELAQQTLDSEHPRQWYWALMDYGAHLKKTAGGRLTQSHHYKKQSPLKGSLREMRGRIIRELSKRPMELGELRQVVAADHRFESALQALLDETLVQQQGDTLRLTDQ